jgi:DNA topoisomerase-1
LEQALALLAQPKARRGAASRREPLKLFDVSPVTNQPVRLMQGRYGPYVSDGVTNASLPRGTSIDEVTPEYALSLLKARAEAGPARRPARKKAGPRTTKAAKGAKKTVRKTDKKAAKKVAKRKKKA